MIEANRGYVALRHAMTGYSNPVICITAGWYALLWHIITPAYAFMADPEFEAEAAHLYGRAVRGESLGSPTTA